MTPSEAAALDRAAREGGGVPERALMESAGRAAAQVMEALFPRGRVVVLAGSGNNGGDAMVAARVLRAWGRDVRLLSAGSRSPDPVLLHGYPLDVLPAEQTARELADADVVIDGILGTGLDGPARGAARESIEALNASGRAVLSLDLPSGLEAGSGRIEGPVVQARATVCFGWPKRGLLFQPARSRCGRLIAVEIGFPPHDSATARLITPAWAAARLPRRAPDTHKGAVGRVLILAGGEGMGGAAIIAGYAASRAGAGLVCMATAAANRIAIHSGVPEAIWVDRDTLSAETAAGMNALVAGPGLGTDDVARASLERALELMVDRPVLLDADALNLHARTPDALRDIARARPVILTPHPGELARLMDRRTEDITADPFAAACEAANAFGCAVLLKGQPSVVASPHAPVLVNTAGSSDTASAGMGDQLSGTIGALLANGLAPRDAAAVGLFFSSRAADICGMGRSLTPCDVADALPAAFARPGADRSPLRLPFVTFDQPERW